VEKSTTHKTDIMAAADHNEHPLRIPRLSKLVAECWEWINVYVKHKPIARHTTQKNEKKVYANTISTTA